MKRARWRCRLRFSCCNPPVLSPAYLGLLSLLRDPENLQTLEAKGPLMWSGLADIGTENAERKECSKLVALSAGCSFYKLHFIEYLMGFPGGAVVKIHLPMQKTQKRLESDPWVEKIPWRRAWNPLQYSCLENPMDRGAWRAGVQGVAKSPTWLSTVRICCSLKLHKVSHLTLSNNLGLFVCLF